MKKKTRTILVILLALIFVISATWSLVLMLRNQREAAFYQAAQQAYVQVREPSASYDPTETPEAELPQELDVPSPELEAPAKADEDGTVLEVDFEALLASGKDVKAWLYVPNTNISYPVVQGPDNDAYERHDYTGAYAWSGSIFLDYRSDADFSGRNTVIYGHNIKSGVMFSQLSQFRDSEFLEASPVFYVVTPEEQKEYEICAVLITDALGPVYTFSFADDAAFTSYLQTLYGDAVATAGEAPAAEDRIVLLSTCTNRTKTERLVVVGRLLAEEGDGAE